MTASAAQFDAPTPIAGDAGDIISTAQRERAARRAIDEASEQMRAELDRGIELGGKTWKPIRAVTFALERRRMDVVRRAGIAGLFPYFNGTTGDTDALTALVLQTAFASGALFDLLAHLLVEDGVEYLPWSPAAAEARAAFFATLVDPADHQRLEANLLMLVLDFFLKASASMPISLRSTVREGIANARAAGIIPLNPIGPTDPRPSTSSETADSSFAATTTSDDGTPSSEPLPDFGASTP
jgi:hypothetical protein